MDNFSLKNRNLAKAVWLLICSFLVIVMITLGGLTRLTDSGLSIVEWNPISGIIPPLSELDWQHEFSKYQLSPEYKQHNKNMLLNEFKLIFWVEFIHRIAGRITGLVFLIPLLYFYYKGKISNESKPFYFLTTVLFALQGVMGWYMVKSGLVNDPYVSHFRLATHLIIAFFIYSLLFWQLMKNNFDILIISSKIRLTRIKFFCYLTIIILFIQVYIGGMVAGLDAGLVYNSFPLMGDSFIPTEINLDFFDLSNPVLIQFFHRMNAYLLTLITFIVITLLISTNNCKLKTVATCIFLVLLIQMFLGIFTLLYHVPILLALIHQIGAIGLLSTLLWALYLIKST